MKVSLHENIQIYGMMHACAEEKRNLEYSCNKYCNLIVQNSATNQLRSLQVY